jgi:two-component system alkaline phosphatase synthesis response regulator PhoP
MKKILVVDDEKDIVELLQFNLEKAGYQVVMAADGQAALELLFKQKLDLVVLDWMLPLLDGIEVCKRMKADKYLAKVPIMMLSAKGEEFDKVLALEIGADDYVCKPFSTRELMARVKALLRRTEDNQVEAVVSTEVLNFGFLRIDTIKYEALFDGKPLDLTKTEFELILTLAKQPNRVYSREQLLQQVWGYDFYGDDRVVDVHIRRLRSKLEAATDQEYIKTVRGVGYKFVI